MIRRQAVEQAQTDTSEEKLRFLQRLDHELKNPLTAMQIALANLEEASDADKGREIRASLRGQVLRMSRLISDLRKLAALEKGQIEQLPVDVGDLLTEVMLAFREEIQSAARQFVLDFDPAALPMLTGDRDLLQLAVYNLIDNAAKFTEPGDVITLRAFSEDDHLVIAVNDTGRGIPQVDLPHVWEDLYRSQTVQGIPGSGVGLAMVKGIIEQHDGTAAIVSSPGAGTTVTLRLPVAPGGQAT